jgi:nucleoside-diphosphate-sugar epimerase
MKPTILVTGGTGYIGSHTCVALLAAGYEVVILDNLSNSRRSVLERIAHIPAGGVSFVEGDIRDPKTLDAVENGGQTPISCFVKWGSVPHFPCATTTTTSPARSPTCAGRGHAARASAPHRVQFLSHRLR